MLVKMSYRCFWHGLFAQVVDSEDLPSSAPCTALVEDAGPGQWRVCAYPSPWVGRG